MMSLNSLPIISADLVIVGDGIAGRALYFELAKSLEAERRELNILRIDAGAMFHKCSLHSTATVCLDGQKKGVSDLGDTLVESFYQFKEILKEKEHKGEAWKGVSKGPHRVELSNQATPKERENFFRRYENNLEWECYFLETPLFLTDLKESAEKKLGELARPPLQSLVIHSQSLGEGQFQHELKLMNGQRVKTKGVVWATGAFSLPWQNLPLSKTVAGHFLSFDYADSKGQFESSWSYEEKGGQTPFKLLYRKPTAQLILGTHSLKNDHLAFDFAAIHSLYESARKKFESIEWPAQELAQCHVGLRTKGPRMRPFWGQLPSSINSWAISNLYKNGMSYAFLAAREISKSVLKIL